MKSNDADRPTALQTSVLQTLGAEALRYVPS